MPRVTDIARQKGNDARYSIKLDGVYAFSLGDLELSASNLRVGSELAEAEVIDWRQRSGEGKAYDKALTYISIRQRSRAEIERYLIRKEYAPEVVEAIIERLTGLSLINDAAFAAAWIRERRRLRPRSAQALRFELAKLGVARDDVDAAMTSELGDEVSTVMDLINRKRRQYPDESKLMAYLARQGFRYDQIKQALERLHETQNDAPS